jgi:hypothetical protein
MKRLFLDIETCPNIGLFWSAGYRIDVPPENILIERRIICCAYKWQGDKKVQALVWDKNQSDETLVHKLIPIMNEADEIVAHYGDGFDIPWIRGRALFYGIIMPVYKTVDTKAWATKFYFNSNKLDYLAQYMGVGKKIRTTYDLWKDIVIHKKKQALIDMVMYNMHDIDLLESVYDKLCLNSPVHTHAGVFEGKERWSCALCGHEKVLHKHHMVTAAGTVKHQMQCVLCKKYNTINNKAYLDWVEYKKTHPEYTRPHGRNK